jgi:hypothetical protein
VVAQSSLACRIGLMLMSVSFDPSGKDSRGWGGDKRLTPDVRLTAPLKSHQFQISAECLLRVGEQTILGWPSNDPLAPESGPSQGLLRRAVMSAATLASTSRRGEDVLRSG